MESSKEKYTQFCRFAHSVPYSRIHCICSWNFFEPYAYIKFASAVDLPFYVIRHFACFTSFVSGIFPNMMKSVVKQLCKSVHIYSLWISQSTSVLMCWWIQIRRFALRCRAQISRCVAHAALWSDQHTITSIQSFWTKIKLVLRWSTMHNWITNTKTVYQL